MDQQHQQPVPLINLQAQVLGGAQQLQAPNPAAAAAFPSSLQDIAALLQEASNAAAAQGYTKQG